MEVLKLLFKKHRDWCDIVESFGVNTDTAEDLVQEMYIRIAKYVKKGNDIMYDDTEINYYYIFRTLKHLHYDLHKKESKIITMDISDMTAHPKADEFMDYDHLYDRFQEELDKLYFYDRKVFDIVQGGVNRTKLSNATNIPYHKINHSYNKTKYQLLKALQNETKGKKQSKRADR